MKSLSEVDFLSSMAKRMNQVAERTEKAHRIVGLGPWVWRCNECDNGFKTCKEAERCKHDDDY